MQNSAEVKSTLGKVATPNTGWKIRAATGEPTRPPGAKIYMHKDGFPVMLKRAIIATGDQMINATSTSGQQGPAVSVTLNSAAGEEMLKITKANLGKRMGVVFIEQRREVTEVDGKKVERDVKEEKVISLATLQGVFSTRFETTGLSMNEARELALLLRGGALAAPIQSPGAHHPAPGQEHRDGVLALVSMLRVPFMIFTTVLASSRHSCSPTSSCYRDAVDAQDGAHAAGIAGIVLTVSMAVDANVLIYERIREELRNGVSPQAATAGFERRSRPSPTRTQTSSRASCCSFSVLAPSRFRHRAVDRHPDIHVHRTDGIARAADAHVRRQTQDHQTGDRLRT